VALRRTESTAATLAPEVTRMTDRSLATVEVNAVSKTYMTRTGPISAIGEVTCRIRHGEFVSLLGPSGCGKSTLLRIVAGLAAATTGSVVVDGRPVTKPQTQMGIMFQSPVLLEWRDALGNVMLQAEARGMRRGEARARALELLLSVGLQGFENKRPSELSGGMQQRVAICRALLHDPTVMLMDEPFGALDALTRDQMNVDLQRLWSQGEKTVIFVTHSIAEAIFLSDRVLVMSPSPGRVDLDLPITIARPRRLAMRHTGEFAEYTSQIWAAFARRGVIREEP